MELGSRDRRSEPGAFRKWNKKGKEIRSDRWDLRAKVDFLSFECDPSRFTMLPRPDSPFLLDRIVRFLCHSDRTFSSVISIKVILLDSPVLRLDVA